uniref:Uncharacterized protein n=1 Tax=Meloidogyne enterolobii TaxID=390850 RepID=A0A6V7TNH4_MELEN|nr:unnamed protein product [Meloidogyne enterolobii]
MGRPFNFLISLNEGNRFKKDYITTILCLILHGIRTYGACDPSVFKKRLLYIT